MFVKRYPIRGASAGKNPSPPPPPLNGNNSCSRFLFKLPFFSLIIFVGYSCSGAHKSGILLRNRFLRPPSEIIDAGAAQIHQNRHGNKTSRFLLLTFSQRLIYFLFLFCSGEQSHGTSRVSPVPEHVLTHIVFRFRRY